MVYSLTPDSDARDVQQEVYSAKQAIEGWYSMPAEQRAAVLLRLADLIDRDADKLAHAESVDNGKPLSLARELDIPRAAANMRFFATACIHFASEAHLTSHDAVNYTIRAPLGVV